MVRSIVRQEEEPRPDAISANACVQAPCTNKRMSACRPTNGRLEMLAKFALHLAGRLVALQRGSVAPRVGLCGW